MPALPASVSLFKLVRRVTNCFQYVWFLHEENKYDWNGSFHFSNKLDWISLPYWQRGRFSKNPGACIYLSCCNNWDEEKLVLEIPASTAYLYSQRKSKGNLKLFWKIPEGMLSSDYFFFWNRFTDKCKHLWELQNPIVPSSFTYCLRMQKFIEISFLI